MTLPDAPAEVPPEPGHDGPYRDGRMHVLADRCGTCVFRPGNLMGLEPGRLKSLVEANVTSGGALTCHSTIYRGADVAPAVCRGFYDAHKHNVQGLWLAEHMGIVTLDPVPPKEH